MLIGAEGFYATNNPFQTSGPKGRIESKMIGNNRIFMRIDLPGVEQGNVTVTIDDSKRGVLIKAEEQSRNKNVSSLRSYETHVTLGYHCCEISTIDNPQVTDGVLRLFISTTPLNIYGVPCSADEGMLFSHFFWVKTLFTFLFSTFTLKVLIKMLFVLVVKDIHGRLVLDEPDGKFY